MNETLPAEMLEYHKQVIQQARNSKAIQNSWFAFLAQKYEIETGDAIDENGVIIRGQAQTIPSSHLPNTAHDTEQFTGYQYEEDLLHL